MRHLEQHHFMISLGSNCDAQSYIPYALGCLREALQIDCESPIMLTDPVDFPYPSPRFTNVILQGTTHYSKAQVIALLHSLETYAGRDRRQPQRVPLDADLICWDTDILKPRDLERPYFKAYLEQNPDERNI